MNVFDWLSNMDMPGESRFDVVEVRFKNGRKEFFRNSDRLNLTTGDAIIVEVPNGHHLGHVSLQGELVRLQMQKKNVANDDEIKKIYRIAHTKDLEKYEEVKKRELPTLYRTREVVRQLNLSMKLSDIEYQADNIKATFFYSADDRVDFRELIKILAGEFRIRVEMRQISLRQEAGRLGGIGVCGRELCCSTWLSDFKNVATSAARYQNLSLNPSKLSGQCGRLKCCLNYELETYMDALKGIPEVEAPLLTERGAATLQKTDIFRKIMWFGFKEDNNWYPINTDRVNEILEMNRAGKKPATLEIDTIAEKEVGTPLNSDLDSLDKKFKDKSKGKKKGGGNNQQQRGGGRRDQRDNRNPNNPNPNNNPNNPQGGAGNKPNTPQGSGNKPNPNNRNPRRPNPNNPNQPRRPNNNPNNPNNPQKG
ncbi:MAG TPA: regulatory iron-sulfur-containing complex subunit RicT [Cyclobacteriaceae bacterium]